MGAKAYIDAKIKDHMIEDYSDFTGEVPFIWKYICYRV